MTTQSTSTVYQPKKVRKAVIAAAGFGTRFLPQTKAMPKEMLPIVDKPIIQYVVEELVQAGIEDIIIVTGYHKRSIEDHFDHTSSDLQINLENGGKADLLKETRKISNLANFAYIRQKGLYGNATPLLNAEHLIGDEPFIYAWGDDFITATPSRFSQLISVYKEHGGSVLACIATDNEADYKRYGFVGGKEVETGLIHANKIIEKPGSKKSSPSGLASVSGYLFEPELFKYLHEDLVKVKTGQEFNMQPSIQRMIDDYKNVWGYEIQNGKFYDTGNKLEYVKAVVEFAMSHEEIGDSFREYMRSSFNSLDSRK
jgi:UTP--glucose-1-phosphate uridylyltransferase